MITKKNGHLDDGRIVEALLCQETAQDDSVREHLASCAFCRQKKTHLAEKLDRLAHNAELYAPAPSRKIALPDHTALKLRGWFYGRLHIFSAGLATLLLILSFYAAGVFKTNTMGINSLVPVETSSDEEVMNQVYALEEDALSSSQPVILDENDMDDNDDFMGLIIPSAEVDMLSLSERCVRPC